MLTLQYSVSLCYLCIPSQVRSFIFIYVVQPEIINNVTDLLENEINPITFICKANGEPAPNITWYFNSIMIDISNTSKYNIFDSLNGTVVTSSLTIINAQSSDVGTYTCFAKNIIGTEQNSGILTVNGKQTCSLLL